MEIKGFSINQYRVNILKRKGYTVLEQVSDFIDYSGFITSVGYRGVSFVNGKPVIVDSDNNPA